MSKKLLDEGRVLLACGDEYMCRRPKAFIRLNLACPKATLKEALERIAKVISSL